MKNIPTITDLKYSLQHALETGDWRRQLGLFLLAVILALPFVFPFYWLLKVSITWPATTLYGGDPTLVIENPSLFNFIKVWYSIDFLQYFANTVIMAALAIGSQVLFCSFAAYAFTRDFYGEGLVEKLLIFGMMVPFQTIFLPSFLITRDLGLVNTYPGLSIIVAISIVNILILRNAFQSIPDSFAEAARLDGASELYILFGIYWPLSKPALATTVILSFIFSWNAYLWPLVIVQDMSYAPLSLGLAEFQSQMAGNFALQYTFAVMVFLPVLVLFLLLQRQFIRSAVLGSLKS